MNLLYENTRDGGGDRDEISHVRHLIDESGDDPTVTRLQMVHDLHRALFGDTWARPEPPAEVWRMLLRRVETIRAQVVASGDDPTYKEWRPH
jgi:hypothetical protein